MGEKILSILFGCLATVLAAVSIILAYIQYRTYIRQSAHNATLATLETGHSTASTTSDDLEVKSGQWSSLIVPPFVVDMDLVQRLCVSKSNMRTRFRLTCTGGVLSSTASFGPGSDGAIDPCVQDSCTI
jgi:hypothetical protein